MFPFISCAFWLFQRIGFTFEKDATHSYRIWRFYTWTKKKTIYFFIWCTFCGSIFGVQKRKKEKEREKEISSLKKKVRSWLRTILNQFTHEINGNRNIVSISCCCFSFAHTKNWLLSNCISDVPFTKLLCAQHFYSRESICTRPKCAYGFFFSQRSSQESGNHVCKGKKSPDIVSLNLLTTWMYANDSLISWFGRTKINDLFSFTRFCAEKPFHCRLVCYLYTHTHIHKHVRTHHHGRWFDGSRCKVNVFIIFYYYNDHHYFQLIAVCNRNGSPFSWNTSRNRNDLCVVCVFFFRGVAKILVHFTAFYYHHYYYAKCNTYHLILSFRWSYFN